jgi:hypothetical protein
MPLRIDQILSLLKTALEAFAQNLSGGVVSIARDPWNVFELLGANSRKYLLILHWAGDENIGEYQFSPLLLHRIEVIIAYNLGLYATPDQALLKTNGERPPLYQSIDDLRTLLLSLQYSSPQTGGWLEYKGAEPVVAPDGVALAAYKLTFGLRAVPGQSNTPTPL